MGGGHFGGGMGGAHFGGGGMGGAGGASFAARGAPAGGANFAASRGAMAAGPSVATATGPRGGWNGGTGWRGHGGWHHHGGGFWPGVAAGALVGGALGSYAYYGGPDYYDYGPDYYADNTYYDDGAPAVEVGVVGGDASYCAQRYRSYDPASGTYLGYDGERHPCP